MPDLPLRPHLHYCGIDPGHKGAIALMDQGGRGIRVWRMPAHGAELDLPALADIFRRLRLLPDVCVGIEWPTAWPGSFANNPRDAENFGRQKGVIEAMAHLKGLDYYRITPQLWKGRLGLGGKTDDPNSKGGTGLWDIYYPESRHLVRGPRGGVLDGPLDALLIAHFLRTRTAGGMKSIADKFGKGSPEAMAFVLGSGRRRRKNSVSR